MQLPVDERTRNSLKVAITSLKGNPYFSEFIAWLKSELQKRDIENRNIKFENQTSEAKGIADLIDIVEKVAACQSPSTDRDQSEQGEGSTSAALLM